MQPSLVDQAQQQAQGNFGNDFGQNGISNLASMGSTIDNARQALAQQQSQAPASAPPVDHSSLWQRLLPTAGSIVGGVLAAPLDPFTAGLASVAAAGVGSGFGKAAENATEGKAAFQGNDLAAAGEGALGQGFGKLAGKGIGMLGGALEKAGAGKAAALDDAAQAEQAANSAKNAVQSRATAYKDVPVPLQKLYNGTDSLNHVSNMGFDETNPDNLVNVSQTTNDILNDNLNKSLANSGPVDLSNFSDLVKNRIAEEDNTLGGYDKVAAGKRLQPAGTPAGKLLDQLETLGQGVAKTNADPEQVRQMITKVGGLAQDAKPTVTASTGAIDPQQRATYNVLTNIYNDLKSTLYNRDEVNSALAGQEPNIQAGDVGSQQLADHLNGVISSGAKNGAQDYLNEISRNIDVNNLGKEGQAARQVITSSGAQDRALADAGVAPATKQSVVNPTNMIDAGGMLESVLGHNPALGMGMMAVNHLARNPAALQGAGKALSSVGGSVAPGIVGSIAGTSPNVAAGAGNTNNDVQLPQMNQGGSILDQALYQAMENPLNGGLSQVGTLLPMVQKANQAQAAEQALAHDFNQAGGGQGLVGGLLGRFGSSLTGGEAASYPAQAAADAAAISQATGVPVQQVEAELPKTTQDQSAAQASLGNINSLIQSLLLQQGQGSQGASPGLLGSVYR